MATNLYLVDFLVPVGLAVANCFLLAWLGYFVLFKELPARHLPITTENATSPINILLSVFYTLGILFYAFQAATVYMDYQVMILNSVCYCAFVSVASMFSIFIWLCSYDIIRRQSHRLIVGIATITLYAGPIVALVPGILICFQTDGYLPIHTKKLIISLCGAFTSVAALVLNGFFAFQFSWQIRTLQHGTGRDVGQLGIISRYGLISTALMSASYFCAASCLFTTEMLQFVVLMKCSNLFLFGVGLGLTRMKFMVVHKLEVKDMEAANDLGKGISMARAELEVSIFGDERSASRSMHDSVQGSVSFVTQASGRSLGNLTGHDKAFSDAKDFSGLSTHWMSGFLLRVEKETSNSSNNSSQFK
ncbi:hypothetical protein HDU81_005204 [Chytriomyces hyalinus]|nr:hypothetical protein HDU81_005204 [Chytriomyces hyalinus]